MSKWIELTKEELEALRKQCFTSLFAMEEIAYAGSEEGYSSEERLQALDSVRMNHMLISKLHVH